MARGTITRLWIGVIAAPLAAIATTLGVLAAAGGGCGCARRAGARSASQRHRHSRALAGVGGGGVSLRASAPARLRAGAPTPLGQAQHTVASGSALTVTVERVIDPLRGSGARPPAEFRAVAVLLRIVNAGPEIYDSSATADVRLVSSGGPVVPLLAKRGVCRTPRQDFDRYMVAGTVRQGCVVFAVPRAAVLYAVSFAPYGQRRRALVWAP